jgi:hypothetical protein
VKTRMIGLVLAFVVASLLPPCDAKASFLDDLLGYNQEYFQNYTYSATTSGQPQNSGPAQYRAAGAYPTAPAPPQQPIVGPRPVVPRVAYQTPAQQGWKRPQARQVSAAATKRRPIRTTRATAVRSSKAYAARLRQQPPAPSAYQPRYSRAPRPVAQPRYYQTAQRGYYANPYQSRSQYYATPNYYQGYYNNTWGSSGQACTGST